jgi:type I restriction enzyme M protein
MNFNLLLAILTLASDLGYDATGRKTSKVRSKSKNGKKKVEIHSTDLFEIEVAFEKSPIAGTGVEDWQECSRYVLPNSGVLGQFRQFEKNPKPFFV